MWWQESGGKLSMEKGIYFNKFEILEKKLSYIDRIDNMTDAMNWTERKIIHKISR